MKPDLRNERPAINSLSHGTSISGYKKPSNLTSKKKKSSSKQRPTDWFLLTLYSDKNQSINQPTNQPNPTQPAPRNTVLLEKLTVPQLVMEFPAFYGTESFITTRQAHHMSLSQATSIRSIPLSQFLKIYFNIILPSTPGSSMWSSSLRPPTKFLYTPLFLLHTCYMPRPSHSSWFGHPNNILWVLKLGECNHKAAVCDTHRKQIGLPRVRKIHTIV